MFAMDDPAMIAYRAQLDRATKCSEVSRSIKKGKSGAEILALIDMLKINAPLDSYSPQGFQLPAGKIVYENEKNFQGVPQYANPMAISSACYLVKEAFACRNADVLQAMLGRYGKQAVLDSFSKNGNSVRNGFFDIIRDKKLKEDMQTAIAMIEVLVDLDPQGFRVQYTEQDRDDMIGALNALDLKNNEDLVRRLDVIRTKIFGTNHPISKLLIPGGITLSICAVLGCVLWYFHSCTSQKQDGENLRSADEEHDEKTDCAT